MAQETRPRAPPLRRGRTRLRSQPLPSLLRPARKERTTRRREKPPRHLFVPLQGRPWPLQGRPRRREGGILPHRSGGAASRAPPFRRRSTAVHIPSVGTRLAAAHGPAGGIPLGRAWLGVGTTLPRRCSPSPDRRRGTPKGAAGRRGGARRPRPPWSCRPRTAVASPARPGFRPPRGRTMPEAVGRTGTMPAARDHPCGIDRRRGRPPPCCRLQHRCQAELRSLPTLTIRLPRL